MKKLISLLALVGIAACTSSPATNVPPVEFPLGFTIDFPCETHGVHTHVLTGMRVVRLYEFSVDGELAAVVSAEEINNTVAMINMVNSVNIIPPNDTQEPR